MHSSAPSFPQRLPSERTSLAVLTALGIVLAGILLDDVYQGWRLEQQRFWIALAENVIPLTLALSVPVLCWWGSWAERGGTYATETVKWALAGSVYTLLIFAAVIGFQDARGPLKPFVLLAQITAVGTAGGFFVGFVLARVKSIRNEYREKEAHLRGLADTIPGVVYQFAAQPDGTFDVRFVSEHAEALLGISSEPDGFYERFIEHIPNPDRDKHRAAVAGAVEEESEWHLEVPFERLDGEKVWLLDLATPAREEEGLLFSGVLLDVTEQEESKRELETYRQYTDRLLDAIDDVFFVFDVDGRLHQWNQSFLDETGYLAEEAESMHASNFVPAAYEDRALTKIGHVFDTGHARLEAPILRKDGSTVPYEFVASRITHPDGSPRLVGIGRDISQREKKEREVRRSERQFEAMFHDPNILVGLLDPEGTVLDINETAMSYIDSSQSNIQGNRLWETPWFSGDKDLEQDVQDWILKAANGKYVEFEAELSGSLGKEVVISGVFRPVRDDTGQVASLLISGRDVTKRNRRRERLLLHDQMLNEVGQAVIATDANGNINFWNRAAERVYGWSEEEALGRNVLDLTVPELAEDRAREIMSALSSGESWTGEFEARRKDGSTFPVIVTDTPVYTDEGEPAGVIGVTTDISDRKARERELREAKEEAERMNRLKSAFLANMSHEIRTPLTSIIGFAEVIGEQVGRGEEGPVARFTRLIENSGRRLLKTLNGVLNLSKLEAGEMNLTLKPVSLVAEAEEAAEEFRPRAQEAGVHLQVVADHPVWAWADEGCLQIVLRNLVSNAIKYTGEGGEVQIQILKERDTAVVNVRDTGIGMDPERAEELFEPFMQASEGLQREYEGTGLGLAVTKEAVDQMHGTIGLETEKGKGSCFTVRLPRAEEPRGEEPA